MTLPSPLLFIPKKQTQDVDFAPHLRQVIQRSYSDNPDSYADELAQLNRARQDALRGSAGSDATARDLLYKYFGQLELLELRFPDLRVPFPWQDAFTHVKISQQSLAYEKASVIFNIGATLSALAASSPRSAPEGLKRAFHSYRCAAGMFVYINDNFLHAPSTDLSKDVVKLLVGLMGAQAVEVFIETMGAPQPKSAGLRSKLCMQASAAYAATVEEVKEWVTKGVFLREWSLLIQAKAKYFASLAQYHRSVADTSAGKYGEALARLSVSELLAKEAHRLAQSFLGTFSTSSTASSLAPDAPVALSELTKAHLALVSDAKSKAQKDNDIVYNEVVPSEASLAPIDKGKNVAEPITIHDVFATADVQKLVGPDLFTRLIPLAVHEAASLYSEEKAQLVRAEVDRVELADEELASALEYMGLPASLARFQRGDAALQSLVDPGPQVRGWADEVRAGESGSGAAGASSLHSLPSGGAGEGPVSALFSRLSSLSAAAASTLQSLPGLLDAESRQTESLRAKYGAHWTQSPAAAEGAVKSFRADLKAHQGSLDEAGRADEKARGLWESIRADVALLASPSSEALEQAFAEVVTRAQALGPGGQERSLLDVEGEEEGREEEETGRRVEGVKEALSRLGKIKKERGEVLRDLKEKVQNDDISQLLLLNRKTGPSAGDGSDSKPSLFAEQLEKFRPSQSRLTQSLAAQQSALSDLNSLFSALSASPRAKEAQGRFAAAERAKRDLVARLGHAAQAYQDVRAALGRGIGFYQDLGELVEGLKGQVEGWLEERRRERERMTSEAEVKLRLDGAGGGGGGGLDRAMGGLSLGSAPSPPPALPPAPSYPSFASSPPPPPASNPYASLPSSGVFSLPSAPTPPSAPTRPAYPSAPPIPTAPAPYSYSSAPPRPPQPPSTASTSSYSSYPSASGLPPPPAPVSYASHTPSLPPPPAPVSYSSYSAPTPPPPPPQQQQYGYQYGQPQQPQQGQYGQQGGYNPYGVPPPQPPRPY
ncbi:hypothetical protein JCM8097_005612 [Rhodosporidiobolus ruineniae]